MATIYADTAGTTTANDGISVDKWLDRLSVRAAGAPDSLLRAELLDTIREFYKESGAWREQIGPYTVYAGDDLVWVNPVDSYSEAIYITSAWFQTTDSGYFGLAPTAGRSTDGRVGSPTHFSLADPYVVRLWPAPDVDMGASLWLDATLVPLPDATRLPNIALSHHFDAILMGATARMLGINNKPWTDIAMSMRLNQLFRREMVKYRQQARQGYAVVDVPWRFPPFA